ncbi:MAG: M12 family metallopeptidase [Longimicrobiaceae bacterium]
MSQREELYREALARIEAEARAALSGGGDPYEGGNGTGEGDGWDDSGHDHYEEDYPIHVCTPKSVPKHLLVEAAMKAVEINPVNAPLMGPVDAVARNFFSDPLRIAVVTAKYWGPQPRRLTVSFLESTPADLRSRIVEHMNAWSRRGGVRFVETRDTGQVRISREGEGYWSYLGTDILLRPRHLPTMNLQGFTMRTPESEYRRVVRHEAGHTLGFPHEHMRRDLVARIDKAKAYAYFARTQGWSRQMVDAQVLTPLDERSIMSTPADQTSIMCYQLPGSITRDGRPIVGGLDINDTDHAFTARIYPQPAPGRMQIFTEDDGTRDAAAAAPAPADEWDQAFQLA